MLNTLLRNKNITLYSLSKQTGIPYATLSDIKNNKVAVDNISTGNLRRISIALSMTMDQVYDELSRQDCCFIKTQKDYPLSKRLLSKMLKLRIPVPEYQTEGRFVLEENAWKLNFTYNETVHSIPFDGIVSNDRFPIIQDMGAFQIENHLHSITFEEQVESVIDNDSKLYSQT